MGAMGRLMGEVFAASKREDAIRRQLELADRGKDRDWKARAELKRLRKEFRVARRERKSAMGER